MSDIGKKRRLSVYKVSLVISFIVIAAINLTPFIWGSMTSFKPIREVLAFPPKFLFTPSFEHYRNIMRSGFLHSVFISLFYALSAIIFGLVLGLMVAYAIKRYRFKGRIGLFYIIICGIPLSIGSAAMVVPNYIYFSNIGMINKLLTLVVLYTAYNLPMATWIIMGGIETIPVQIEESMIIDGASRAYLIFNMTPRLCLPAMASAALFIFIGAWNEFVASSVMVSSTALKPIQVNIYGFLGFYGREWGPLTAAATAGVIPILLVFTCLGKLLISGLTQGSVKE